MRGPLDAEDSRSLRTGFLSSVARYPERLALTVDGENFTYAELDTRARRIAGLIVDRLGFAASRVGIFASRSIEAYTGTLAAMYAGAAFVPLNRRFTVARTAAMIRRSRLDAIIVDAGSAPQLHDVLAGVEKPLLLIVPDGAAFEIARTLDHNASGEDDLRTAPPLHELPPMVPDDIAYLLFTSGTTGEPKGVGVCHSNVVHYLDVVAARYDLGPNDRCSQLFDQTFDLSVHDLFATWGAGASLHVPRPIDTLAPVRFVNFRELTSWFSVPSAAALAFKKGMLKVGSMPSLRLSLFCGEPLPAALADAWQTAAGNSRVENLYGPTELTIACFSYHWRADVSPQESVQGIVPIGRPFPGLAALLVDDALEPVGEGQRGELLVCGPQTTPGYWSDEERTRERFVTLPVADTVEKLFYRTGDRVERLPTGNYAFIGRTDNQIKLLGFRVELGEIEAVLLKGEGVGQAAALGWPIVDGSAQRVVAFVSGRGVNVDALRSAARTELPDYMVPERFIMIEDFPVNANGKIDRRELALWLEQGTLE